MKNKIGVYICQCGSNISDYVDVEKVKEAFVDDKNVVIAKTTMFACADSTQNEMVDDIKSNGLDSVVVASCSPKLHLSTFRNVAERAGLNPYNYVHANIREQTSWAHSDNPVGATAKAIQLVKAAVAKVKNSVALTPQKISAENAVLVVGAGVAGLRAAIALADMGTKVYLIEKGHFVGGRTSQWTTLFTTDQTGEEIIFGLYKEVIKRDNITLLTGTQVTSNSGSIGNFETELKITPRYINTSCKIEDGSEFEKKLQKAIDVCPIEVDDDFNFNLTKRKAIYKNFKSEFPECPAIDMEHCTKCGECVKICEGIELDQKEETKKINVGAILLATGFDPYEPKTGEFGYNEIPNVITLQQLKRIIEVNDDKLIYKGKEIKSLAYIYCVGSRQVDGGNKHCSRYCCTSTIHTAIQVREKYQGISNFHINRGIRTYGKQEVLYNKSSKSGDVYFQFDEDTMPEITQTNGQTTVKVKDILTLGREFEIPADLIVLVTGMAPRKGNNIADILKVPIGRDKFFNEVHLKLKPVETVIDGVYISGASQAPYNITEAVKSALSASVKANGLLSKGEIELEPTLAMIYKEKCVWCDECTTACPFGAIIKIDFEGKKVAQVEEAKCKGCGMCLPVCPENAIDLKGFTDVEMETMIDAMIS